MPVCFQMGQKRYKAVQWLINMKNFMFKISVFIKLIIYKLFSKRIRLIDDALYTKMIFFVTFGRIPDFDHPHTFNEYICARKVRRNEYSLWRYTDKYEVRKYVCKKVGEKYLNKCFGVYDSFNQINFEKLPSQFVLKGTHGSAYNLIVTNKDSFDRSKAEKLFTKWLSQNFYYLGREKNYYKISPRIMCDKFLKCKTYPFLPEIKVFCFNGKAKFIECEVTDNGKTFSNIYDTHWNRLEVRHGYDNFNDNNLTIEHDKIIVIAEKLAENFDFVRVDLYVIDGNVIFSELTFHPGGGMVPFTPASFDYKFAKYFEKL